MLETCSIHIVMYYSDILLSPSTNVLFVSRFWIKSATFPKCQCKLNYRNSSVAFNTIVRVKLVIKLRSLGLNTSLCNWILNFLMGRPQVVKMGSLTSSVLTLSTPSYVLTMSTGAPQGCILSPLLYALYTHDCVATRLHPYVCG